MASVIAITEQKSVTTAGTAVQFTSNLPGLYEIKPLAGNGGSYIYVGNDGSTTGDVTSSNGYQLQKGLDTLLISVTNPKQLWLDADTDGDGACIIRIAGDNTKEYPPTL